MTNRFEEIAELIAPEIHARRGQAPFDGSWALLVDDVAAIYAACAQDIAERLAAAGHTEAAGVARQLITHPDKESTP